MKQVYIIGGGAAGFFSAITLAELNPNLSIHLLEKSNKLLSKVRVSGGGRCNITHDCHDVKELVKNYPRGSKELISVFQRFGVKETCEWFEKHGLALKIEEDGRMFPKSNSSESVIDCFIRFTTKLNISIYLQNELKEITFEESNAVLRINNQVKDLYFKADAVIIACGGFNKLKSYDFIKELGHKIHNPLPSLFTINLKNDYITQLMGLSVPKAKIKANKGKYQYEGPVLITHWGLSGPAVLKLSAFAAEWFHEKSYETIIQINWLNTNAEEARLKLERYSAAHPKALVENAKAFDFPKRLWDYFIAKAGFPEKRMWREVPKKNLNKLVEIVCNDEFTMQGKTTFKEEFVTCGGVSLQEVDMRTMQSKKCKFVYFSGEVLDIDGITGGFNFQAAWSTAYLAACAVAEELKDK